MITIVDYGLGNIKAFANTYKRLNTPCQIATNSTHLQKASKIILPGVGAFDHAMTKLNNSGMREALDEMVIHKKTPVIGICVGMQMMANSSEEGKVAGLKWIDAKVKKMNLNNLGYKNPLPHMGWNTVETTKGPLFKAMDKPLKFYFLHSYYFKCNNPNDVISSSNYGFEFTCAVNHSNIFGVQFHPEKSHHNGVQLLKNFAAL